MITPIDHGLDYIGKSRGVRAPGVHMSDLYNSYFQELYPKKYDKSRPMNPMHLEMGLAWEDMLEDGLKERMVSVAGEDIERPGEFTTATGIHYNPDLLIYSDDPTRLGEIKLTWMSSREMPTEVEYGWPVRFQKYDMQMKAYCVTPDTRILTGDLRWVPAGSIKASDGLMGFDEFPTSGNKRRRWRRTTVKRAGRVTRPVFELSFADGSTVKCSDDHQWLGRKGTKYPKWFRTADIAMSPEEYAICKPLSVWEPRTDFDAGYISGMLDGEACLCQVKAQDGTRALRLDFAQLPGLVMGRMWELLAPMGFFYREVSGSVNRLISNKFLTILETLGTFRPLRLLENFGLIDEFPATGFAKTVQVTGARFLGEQEVCAIETTTGTYFAEGFASHNCYWLGLLHARLYVFHINGEYAWMKKKAVATNARDAAKQAAEAQPAAGGPVLLAFDIEYTQHELDENWLILESHGKSMGLLDSMGRAIHEGVTT